MEFSQTSSCDSVDYDTKFVREEMKDNNITRVNDNGDARTNEQCITFTEDKPVVAEHFQNSAAVQIKLEVTSSAGAQEFVFLVCARNNVNNNENILENQNANSSVSHSSPRDEENIQKPCPYCGKNVTSLKAHKVTCELRFVYPCTLCPTVLYHTNTVKRHIQHKHSKNSNSLSKVEIHRNIVDNRVELDVETATEKYWVVSKMMTDSSLRAKINARSVLTDKALIKFVFPNTGIQPRSTETSTSLFAIAERNNVSQSNSVSNAIETPSTNKESVAFGLDKEQQPSVHHRIINPIDKQCESGSTRIAATKKSIYCDECTYQTHKKSDLIEHIRIEHSLQLNLVSFQCWKCGKNFTGYGPMIAHKVTCNANPVYRCLFCPNGSLLKGRILAHIRDQHAEKVADKNPYEIATLVEAKKTFVDFFNFNPGEQFWNEAAVVVDSNTQQRSNVMPTKVVDEENADVRNRCVIATKEHHELDCQLIVKVQNKSPKVTDTDKKSTKTFNTEKKKVVGIQKENATIVETRKRKRRKIIKTKAQYLFCDHCQLKTRQKDELANHIMKKHSAELNLAENRKDRFNYRCTFCPQVYLCIDKVKSHVVRKHSLELVDVTVDEVAQKIFSKRTKLVGPTKYKADSFVDPDEIDATTLEHVLVYCAKCKTLKTIPGTLRTRKSNCRDCDSRIIYVCSKCKNSHTLNYTSFRKHWSQCQEMNEISQDCLDKLVVHKCPQCQFYAIHKYKLAMHVVRTKHKLVKGARGKSVDVEQNEEAIDDVEAYDEHKFAVQITALDLSTMTHRYCPKCDKVVTEEMQPRKPASRDQVCQVCETYFHAQCVKCNVRRSNWVSMRYHLNTKCFPGEYLCIKCTHRTPSWKLMQKHYVIHRNSREIYHCEYCSFQHTRRWNYEMHLKHNHPDKTNHSVITIKNYACDLCSFTSKLKGSLKTHLLSVHSTKKHKCKLCKFRTRHVESLRRHVRTRHPSAMILQRKRSF